MEVTTENRRALERLVRSEVEPYRKVIQARALLMLADGVSIRATTRELETWPKTVMRYWNHDSRPFIWKKTADEIITKVQRGRTKLTAVTKSATDH